MVKRNNTINVLWIIIFNIAKVTQRIKLYRNEISKN